MSQDLAIDTSKQAINSGYLEFYELQLGTGTVNTLFFHDGKNENTENITYQGNTYIALPIILTGVEVKGDGAIARPTLTVANVESILKSQSKFKTAMRATDPAWNAEVDGEPVTNTDFEIDDLIGSKLTRRRTLEKYLTSNPPIEFPKDEYIIDRIQQKTNLIVVFELAAPFDLAGIRVPGRTVVGKYCPWKYQGASTELIASDRQGACVWKKTAQITHGDGNTSSAYFTVDDEPIMRESNISGQTYSSGTSYNLDTTVLNTSDGVYYQSKANSNQGNAVTNKVFWRIVRHYTTWSLDGTKSYTVDANDPRKNSYVLHDNTIFRVLIAHTRNSNLEPEVGSSHWERADVCGKLLESCKIRYQVIGRNNNQGFGFMPSTNLNTNAVLPFGGFPGSRKFR